MATTVAARQLPGKLLRLLSVVIAPMAIALVALTISQRRPDTSSLPPGDVIDQFLSARQMGDVGTAIKLFKSDARLHRFRRQNVRLYGSGDTSRRALCRLRAGAPVG
jgi:hypothetical protein